MKITLLTAFTFYLLASFSCVSSKDRKSGKYYLQHEAKISEILASYNSLYKTQPFNIGFVERDYSKIGLDIITDSIRYAITNELNGNAIKETVLAFGYDTVKLRKLYTDLYEIKSIWLGKDDVYHKGNKYQATYLTFRSVAIGSPFLDRKYYTLVFFDPSALNDDLKNILAKQGFTNIKGNVYYNIMGKFR